MNAKMIFTFHCMSEYIQPQQSNIWYNQYTFFFFLKHFYFLFSLGSKSVGRNLEELSRIKDVEFGLYVPLENNVGLLDGEYPGHPKNK